jgi:hypothetical protein
VELPERAALPGAGDLGNAPRLARRAVLQGTGRIPAGSARRPATHEEEILTEIVTWIAPVTGIVAAVMVAANVSSRFTGYGFIVFTVSSVAWVALGVLESMTSVIVQNAVLFVINLLGIYRWLFVRSRYEAGAAAAAARASRRA